MPVSSESSAKLAVQSLDCGVCVQAVQGPYRCLDGVNSLIEGWKGRSNGMEARLLNIIGSSGTVQRTFYGAGQSGVHVAWRPSRGSGSHTSTYMRASWEPRATLHLAGIRKYRFGACWTQESTLWAKIEAHRVLAGSQAYGGVGRPGFDTTSIMSIPTQP